MFGMPLNKETKSKPNRQMFLMLSENACWGPIYEFNICLKIIHIWCSPYAKKKKIPKKTTTENSKYERTMSVIF